MTGHGDEILEEATVVIHDGWIAAIEQGHDDGDIYEGWVVPGFVDTHCHGALGAEFGSPDRAGSQGQGAD